MTEIIYGSIHTNTIKKEGIDETLKKWEEQGYRFTYVIRGENLVLSEPKEVDAKPLELPVVRLGH